MLRPRPSPIIQELARDPNGIEFKMRVSIASNDYDKRDCPKAERWLPATAAGFHPHLRTTLKKPTEARVSDRFKKLVRMVQPRSVVVLAISILFLASAAVRGGRASLADKSCRNGQSLPTQAFEVDYVVSVIEIAADRAGARSVRGRTGPLVERCLRESTISSYDPESGRRYDGRIPVAEAGGR